MTHFDPNNSAHVIKRQGKPFITFVGLQAKLIDQGKFIKSSHTEVLQWPWENEQGLMVVRVTIEVQNKDKIVATYQGLGDAGVGDKEDPKKVKNVGDMVALHYIRMAETRGVVRALRLATRSEYTASEELGGDND